VFLVVGKKFFACRIGFGELIDLEIIVKSGKAYLKAVLAGFNLN
jgi:hypothetical protein